MWTTRTATGRSWQGGGGAWEAVFFVVAGGGQGSVDLVLDLREGVCCVLCVFVCVCAFGGVRVPLKEKEIDN